MANLGPSGVAGDVLGVFKSKKIRQKFFSPEADAQGKLDIEGLGTDRNRSEQSLGEYDIREAQRARDWNNQRRKADRDYTSLFTTGKSMAQQDPLDAFRTAGDLGMGWFNQYADRVGPSQDAANKASDLRLGLYGDRGSSYGDTLRNNNNSSALTSAFNTFQNQLNPNLQSIVSGRQGNLAQLQGLGSLIDRRSATADYGEGVELNPAYAGLDLRHLGMDNTGQAIANAKANTAGWYVRDNWADKAAGVSNALAKQDYGSQLVGGLLNKLISGVGGEGGGGGGGGARNSPGFLSALAQQQYSNNPQNNSSIPADAREGGGAGGGGGGGGINMQSIIKLLPLLAAFL